MARNKENLEDDFDFDLDMDFEFPGDKPLPPPKNAREAVTRSLKDGFKGVKDELLQNPVKEVGKVLEKGMPSSLRTEYSDLTGAVGDVKKAASDALSEVKKSGQEFAKGLKKLTPEGSKFRKLLDKLSGDEGETLRGPSKEQQQADEINGAIVSALGAQQEQAQVQEAIRNAMEEKRAATTAGLLQSIYAEVKMERTFHYKITNSYYRKSLEIQMKQLYTQKELLELTRTNFAGFKAQFEAMVLNTGLPDILKITKAEAMGKDLGAKMRKELIDNLYKQFNPMKAVSDKMVAKINQMKSNITGGFEMAMSGIDMAGGLDGMEGMGMTKSGMIGMMIGDGLKSLAYGKLGEKLAKTKHGKNFIFGAKNAMADPSAYINEMANKKRTGKLGKAQDWFWNMMSDFTGSASKNSYKFEKKDLNSAQIFDGRAHQAIVKVIPGLLSKIHAEIKANRLGGKPEDHELAFDNKTETFTTHSKMASSAINDIKKRFSNNAGYYASSFSGLLQEHGGPLSANDINAVNRALVNYLLSSSSSIAPASIAGSQFLNQIQDKKIREKVRKYARKVLAAAKDNPNILDDITMVMNGIRRAMPNPSGYMDDFHKSGNMEAAVKMGLAKKTPDGYVYNDAALNEILAETVLGDPKVIAEQKSFLDQQLADAKAKVKGTVDSMKSKATGFMGTMVDKVKKNSFFGSIKEGWNKVKGMSFQDAVNLMDEAYVGGKKKATEKYEEGKEIYGRMRELSKTEEGREFMKQRGKQYVTTTASGIYSSGKAFAKAKYEKGSGFIKSLDRHSAVNYFNQKKLKAKDLVDEHVLSRIPEKHRKSIDSTIGKIQKVSKEMEKKIAEGLKVAGDTAVASDLRAAKQKVDEKVADFIEYANKNGYNKEAFDNYVNEIKLASQEAKVELKEKGISSASDIMLKATTGASKEEWEAKAKEKGKAAGKKMWGLVKDFAKERPVEELQKEYLDSEEVKKPNGLTFTEWVEKMGFKTKGSTLKRIRKATFAMDRKIAGFLLKLPFRIAKFGIKGLLKVPGIAWKGLKGAVGLGGSIAGGAASQTVNLVKDMFKTAEKAGGEAGASQAAQMASVTAQLTAAGSLQETANAVKAQVAGAGEKKERKGSWISKLNLFNNKGKDNTEKNVKEAGKKGPIWMILGLLGGVFGFIKKMFGGLGSILKWTAKGFGFLFKMPAMLISGIGKAITGLGSMIAGGAKGAFDWVKDKAGSMVEGAKNLVSKGVDKVKQVGSKIAGGAMDIIKKVVPDKILNAAKAGFQKLGNLGTKFKNFLGALKRVGARMGGSVARSIGKFVAKYVVTSATGIGFLLTAGFAAWDVGWILKYWIGDGLTFGNAICKQMLGITPFGGEEPDPFTEEEDGSGESQAVKDQAVANSAAENANSSVGGRIAYAGAASDAAVSQARANGSGIIGARVAGAVAGGKALLFGSDSSGPAPAGAPAEYGKRPALTKIDNPSLNESPYIKVNGKTADIKGLKPDFKQKVLGFAQDYYQWTGKQLVVNSANRSLDDQIKMWEAEAKVKWTGDRKKDEAAVAAAGGKFFNFRGGTVAYPSRNPKPGHLTGEAVDLNIAAMPGGDKINDVTRTPWLDDLLAKWGLRRPLTQFNGYSGRRERWHIAAMPGPWSPPVSPEAANEPEIVDEKTLPSADKAQIMEEKKQSEESSPTPSASKGSGGGALIGSIGADSNWGGGGPSAMSGGSPVNNNAVAAASTTTAAMTSVKASTAAASNSTMSVAPASSPAAGGGNFTELLAKQLEVQTQSMNYLKIISEKIGSLPSGDSEEGGKTPLGGQPGTTDFPGQAISLKRKEFYV